MSATKPRKRWAKMRTPETRQVEQHLQQTFEKAEAYRYNCASIRVRVTDSRFKGKSHVRRDTMVEKLLKELPEEILRDIVNLITRAPSEENEMGRDYLVNYEFDHPSPSRL